MTDRGRSAFAAFWAASSCSYLGDGVRSTALPLLAATATSSPAQVGLVAAAAGLPWLLLGLPAEVVVDRARRLHLMVMLQAGRGLAVGLAAAALITGHLGVSGLVLLALSMGTAEVGYDLAAQAVLPQLVADDGLAAARGHLVSSEVASFELAGPLLGGVLFAVGRSVPLVVDAVSFLISAGLLARIRGARPELWRARDPSDPPVSLRAELRVGFAWLAASPRVWSLTAVAAAVNVGVGGFYAVLVLFARSDLRLGPVGFAALVAAGAVGSLAAGTVAGRLTARRRTRLGVLLATPALVACCFAAVAATSAASVAAAAMVAFGSVVTVFNVAAAAVRQSIVPAKVLGRVLSAHRLICWGALPLGALAAGAVGSAAGLRTAVGACAGAVVVLAVPVLVGVGSSVLDRNPAGPSRRP